MIVVYKTQGIKQSKTGWNAVKINQSIYQILNVYYPFAFLIQNIVEGFLKSSSYITF